MADPIGSPLVASAPSAAGLASDAAPDGVLGTLTRLLARLLDAPVAFILLRAGNRRALRAVAAPVGLWRDLAELPPDHPICRLVDGPDPYPAIEQWAGDAPGFVAALATPLRGSAGALVAVDVKPRAWSARERTLLEEVALAVDAALREEAAGPVRQTLAHRRETERADALAVKLRERDDVLALAERSAGIGVWDVDLSSGTARGTPQFFRIMGLPPTDDPVPQDIIRSVRHPDDRERVLQGFREAMTSGSDTYEIEYRIIRPDGEVRWVFGRGRVVRDAAGNPVRYSGIDMDVTERKAAEAALAESEERLRLAQEAAGIGTWDWDIRGSAMRWSDHQWRLHGLVKLEEEPSYDEWRRTIHPDDLEGVTAAIGQAVAGRTRFETEYRVLLPDGRVRWLVARGSVMADKDGRPARLLGVSVDVTDRHAAEDALARMNQELERRVAERTAALEAEAARRAEAETLLHQAQKMEAVGQLTGGVAHDFNNLLTVIIGNLETLHRRLVAGSADREAIQRLAGNALGGAQRAAALTQHLLAFSRRQPLDPRPLDLNRLVAGMSNLLKRTLGEAVAIETVLAAGLWRTMVDANQLESAILNLAVNARDAMPDGGRLTIETANILLDEAYAAHEAEVLPGQYVMVAVTDCGVGMPREVMERAFEPFFTTKHPGQGTGLGLSQVYGFVKQSGGHVKIYTEPGLGTSIKLYLPRLLGEHEEPAHEVVRDERRAAPPERETTVLVVEDDENVRAHSAGILAELGYRVLTAADGAAALALLEAEPAVALLFTDVGLPGGMTGRQLADEARRRFPALRVLFTTAYARNAIVHDGRLDAGVQLVTKPFTFASLAAKVREVLEGEEDPGSVLVVEDEPLVRAMLVDFLHEIGFRVEEAGTAREALDKVKALRGRIAAAVIDLGLPDRRGSTLAVELRATHGELPIVIASGASSDELRRRFAGDARIGFLAKPYSREALEALLGRLGLSGRTPAQAPST